MIVRYGNLGRYCRSYYLFKWEMSTLEEIEELNDVYEATINSFTPPQPLDSTNPTQDEQDTIEACSLLKSLLNDLLTEFPKFISL